MKPSRFAFEAGFTLIELIMVVVMLGVLAVFAAPRILNTGDYYARGFHDETQAYLRYAQKTAIAQRRTVCVTFTSSSVALAIASAPATSNCSAAATLKGPKGESPAIATARSGVTFSSPPTSFNFDGLGQPITAAGNAQATQTIQVSGVSQSITVETATGYVHE
ncbi:MAG: prepilin-type N-terminal cleavage/methylation domain-containing protein [Burkholderiales bacterium]|nr:prepilin-type N-terminal cleavage/methylation domain-containing protein [Burkholderiales bacterium]